MTFDLERDAGEVTSFSNLLTCVRRLRKESPTGIVWLRGHRGYDWDLKPTVGRPQTFAGKTVTFDDGQEKRLLQRFRRHAYQFFNRDISLWEAISLARHYGLPVRIMDWTSNPLAALYFATSFTKKNETHGAIWFLLPSDNESGRLDVFTAPEPLSVCGLRLIYPATVTQRIAAQSSTFTIQDKPRRNMDEYSMDEPGTPHRDILKLGRLRVPKDKKPTMLREMEAINVNWRTLFPDLDGLGQGLWQSEVLREI